jgi:hypothetical protein
MSIWATCHCLEQAQRVEGPALCSRFREVEWSLTKNAKKHKKTKKNAKNSKKTRKITMFYDYL